MIPQFLAEVHAGGLVHALLSVSWDVWWRRVVLGWHVELLSRVFLRIALLSLGSVLLLGLHLLLVLSGGRLAWLIRRSSARLK